MGGKNQKKNKIHIILSPKNHIKVSWKKKSKKKQNSSLSNLLFKVKIEIKVQKSILKKRTKRTCLKQKKKQNSSFLNILTKFKPKSRHSQKKKSKRNVNDIPNNKKKQKSLSPTYLHSPSQNPSSGKCFLKKKKEKGTLMTFPMTKTKRKPSHQLTFIAQAEIQVQESIT